MPTIDEEYRNWDSSIDYTNPPPEPVDVPAAAVLFFVTFIMFPFVYLIIGFARLVIRDFIEMVTS